MKTMRRILASLILIAGGILAGIIWKERPSAPMKFTMATFYQVAGKGPGSLNRVLTRIVPVNDLDEGRYGEAVYQSYESGTLRKDPRAIYLNRLTEDITSQSSRHFTYHVLLLNDPVPNAFAMPGGILFVTTGLFDRLRTESELVAVLAHEVGHVELGHCMEQIRFQLAAQKIGAKPLGELADFGVRVMASQSWNKTRENEADEYSLAYLEKSSYDPDALALSFDILKESEREAGFQEPTEGNPVLEYFQTHPHLTLRALDFHERARRFARSESDQKRYTGKTNKNLLIPLTQKAFPDEWIVFPESDQKN